MTRLIVIPEEEEWVAGTDMTHVVDWTLNIKDIKYIYPPPLHPNHLQIKKMSCLRLATKIFVTGEEEECLAGTDIMTHVAD